MNPDTTRSKLVTVNTDGDWTEVQHTDGRPFAVFVWPNARHSGLWAAFEGASQTQMVRPLSGGYASREEGIAAGIHLLLEGQILPPAAEAAGVHLDPASAWQLMVVDRHWPPVLGWIGAVDHVTNDGRERYGLVISNDEMERLRTELERGVQPRISFPMRRLISNMEASVLRLEAARAQFGG